MLEVPYLIKKHPYLYHVPLSHCLHPEDQVHNRIHTSFNDASLPGGKTYSSMLFYKDVILITGTGLKYINLFRS